MSRVRVLIGSLLLTFASATQAAPIYLEFTGTVTQTADMRPAIERGVAVVRAGGVCVIDARVAPGYDAE